MLDQNTDRMWYVIGAVIIGAAIILIMNTAFPQLFASVGDTFKGKTERTTEVVDGIAPRVPLKQYSLAGLEEFDAYSKQYVGGDTTIWGYGANTWSYDSNTNTTSLSSGRESGFSDLSVKLDTPIKKGDVVYVHTDIWIDDVTHFHHVGVSSNFRNYDAIQTFKKSTGWSTQSVYTTYSQDADYLIIKAQDSIYGAGQYKVRDVTWVNLTAVYGKGKEPTLEWCNKQMGM